MIYPTILKLKEELAEYFQLPVYLQVPMKAKRPYGTLVVENVTVGQGGYHQQIMMEGIVTIWFDGSQAAMEQRLLERLRGLSQVSIEDAEESLQFLAGPTVKIKPIKEGGRGYQIQLRGRRKG
jgi:hypothetical protein